MIPYGFADGRAIGANEGELRHILKTRRRLTLQANGPPFGSGHERAVAGQQEMPAEQLRTGPLRLISTNISQPIGHIPAQEDTGDRQLFKRSAQLRAGVIRCDARCIFKILDGECGHRSPVCMLRPSFPAETSEVSRSAPEI